MLEWIKENMRRPMVVLWAISFFVAFVPLDFIASAPPLTELLGAVPALLPGIQRYIDVSGMPNVAAVYFPMLALVSPIAVLEVWRSPVSPDRWFTSFWCWPSLNTFRIVLIALLTIGTGWAVFVVGGYEIGALSVRTSRVYLALLGCFYAGASFWLCFGLLTRAIYSIFKGN